MIDVDKCVKEQAEKLENVTNEQKQDFIEMATAFGNFMNCIWKQRERENDEKNRKTS